MKFSISVLIFFCLVSCQTEMNYVSIVPQTTRLPVKIDKVLNVYIENVREPTLMEGSGNSCLKVRDYRKTLEDAIRKSFGPNFEQVNFTDTLVKTGLALHIFRIWPYWVMKRAPNYVGPGGNASSGTGFTRVSAAFQIQATLYYNNEQISRLDGVTYSRMKIIPAPARQKKAFIQGLTMAIQNLHESIVIKPAIAQQIQ